ncbi:hypothetical protein BDV97DRAFT_396200 [Delphinella strobiligena]|nr:hypothetical protein BDV97DRAFT_396200 [Delphinella strobiligena]
MLFPNSIFVKGMLEGRKGRAKKHVPESIQDKSISLAPTTPRKSGKPDVCDNTPNVCTKSTMPSAPSSTFERPQSPAPHWPLPSLANGNDKGRVMALSNNKEVRPSTSKASLSARDAQPRSPRVASSFPSPTGGRFPATPAFPPSWTRVHDRAICVLDACGYSLDRNIRKLKSAFPELARAVLTPAMIDKRLRTLDQDLNVDFFRLGLDHLLAYLSEDKRRSGGIIMPPPEDRKTEAFDEVCESASVTATLPSLSSLSVGRQNSENGGVSTNDYQYKATPERDTSSPFSKTPKSPVRSCAFGTGYMSYRTAENEDDVPPRCSGLTQLVKSAPVA